MRATSESGGTFLDVRDLTAKNKDGPGLDGLSLSLARGELHATVSIDPGGSTLLFDILSGCAQPEHGQVLLEGADIIQHELGARGFISVGRAMPLFPHLTAHQNILFPLEARGLNKTQRMDRVRQLARDVGLADAVLNMSVGRLTPLERLRASLARALAGEPVLLLLDHPMKDLGPIDRWSFLPELKRLHRRFSLTTLLADDNLANAMMLANRISIIGAGRCRQSGSPDEIFRRPLDAAIASLAGPCNLIPITLRPDEQGWICHGPGLLPVAIQLAADRAHAGMVAGPACMLVRPQAVHPFLGIRRFDVLTEGKIVEILPQGHNTLIHAEVRGISAPILADLPQPILFPLEIGRNISLGWNIADIFVLPKELNP